MSALVTVLVAVLRVLLPALIKSEKSTAEDSKTQPELKKRLRGRVRGTWAVSLLALLLLVGCGHRTIYVPDGEPVRLREAIPNAKVWIKNSNGEVVSGTIDLHEGWYCLSMPKEDN